MKASAISRISAGELARLLALPLLLLGLLGAGARDLNEAGKAAYSRGDYAAAERLFAQAVAQSPQDPVLHYHRAVALTQLGRWREATAAYEAALRFNPPPAVAKAAREALRSVAPLAREPARPAPPAAEEESPPPRPPRSPSDPTVVPLVRGAGGWLAEVTLNDSWTGLFLVDTGASLSLISPAVARELRLEPGPDTPQAELMTISGRTRGPAVTLDSVRVGAVETRGVQAVIHEGAGLDGILGTNFLSGYAVTFDTERALLTLRPR